MSSTSREERVVALLEQLRNESPIERHAAVKALVDYAPKHILAMNAIIESMVDPNLGVRMLVGRSLVRLGKRATPALITALASDRAELRDAAISTLTKLKSEAHAAIPALLELKDQNETATSATNALEAIQAEPRRDWHSVLEASPPWVALFVASIAIVFWFADLVEIVSSLDESASKIAVGWGIVGTYAGAVIGLKTKVKVAVWKRMAVLGICCGIAGTLVGRYVAHLVEPITKIFG